MPKEDSTSYESLKKMQESGKDLRQREKVLLYILGSKSPVSRNDITDALAPMRLSAVCARVKELMDANEIQVWGTKRDHETERSVETLGRAIREGMQTQIKFTTINKGME